MSRKHIDLNHQIPAHLIEAGLYVEKILKQAGCEAWLVGGSVRDLLLGKKISDIDYTTNAHPKTVLKLFKRTVPVGIDFGTVLVLHKNISIEVTTYRLESGYIDGRRPGMVKFGSSLEEDITRRDYTINGLAYSILDNTLVDYCGGMQDLEKKIIQTIGNAEERFSEDGLRPVRGCRIASALNFQLEPETMLAMKNTLPVSARIARERLFDEWRKTLKKHRGKSMFRFWQLLHDTGLFETYFHALTSLCKATDTTVGSWAVLQKMLCSGRITDMGLYAACLIAAEFSDRTTTGGDIPTLKNTEPERWLPVFDKNFIHRFLKEMKFPQKDTRRAVELLFSPILLLFAYGFNKTQFKKSISNIAPENAIAHLRFARAFFAGVDIPTLPIKDRLALSINYLREIKSNHEPVTIKQLAVNGNDLKHIGIEGAAIGEALQKLLEVVITDPSANDKQALLAMVNTNRSEPTGH